MHNDLRRDPVQPAGRGAYDAAAIATQEYQQHEEAQHERLQRIHLENTDLRQEALITQRRAMLQVEKSTLRTLFTRGAIDADSLRALTADVDRRPRAEDAPPDHITAAAPQQTAPLK